MRYNYKLKFIIHMVVYYFVVWIDGYMRFMVYHNSSGSLIIIAWALPLGRAMRSYCAALKRKAGIRYYR